jgi:hypothetical protein
LPARQLENFIASVFTIHDTFVTIMESLPPELLRSILLASVSLCRGEKNVLFPLRLVNKRFDFIVREYVFKTIQLDFSSFIKGHSTPKFESLQDVGQFSHALYCDMMVVRDQGMMFCYHQ